MVLAVWERTQQLPNNGTMQGLLEQILAMSLNLWTLFAQCYFWSAIWRRQCIHRTCWLIFNKSLSKGQLWNNQSCLLLKIWGFFKSAVILIDEDIYCKIGQKSISLVRLFILTKHDLVSIVDVVRWHRMAPLWMRLIAHSQATMQPGMEVPSLHW